MLKILLVDEQTLFNESLSQLLSNQNIQVEVCAALDTVHEVYDKTQPNVVLINAQFGGQIVGIDFCVELLKLKPDARIVCLSEVKNPYLVQKAYKAGVLAFIWKGEDGKTLVEALEEAAKGGLFYTNEIAKSLAKLSHTDDPILSLNDEELELFILLADGATNQEAADKTGSSISKVAKLAVKLKDQIGVQRSADLTKLAIRYFLISP